MAQILPRRSNTLLRATLLGAPLVVLALGSGAGLVTRWAETSVNEPVEQPIEFDHQHHVGLLGLDCRYCHASVEDSSFAGMPATEVCMQCHSEVWVGLRGISQVHSSYRTGVPIAWLRVYNLDDFSYFDHSIHVAKGIGCVTCHGRMDQMAVTYQTEPLTMQWCLECHREPEKYVRPREEVFNLAWAMPTEEGGWEELARTLEIEPVRNQRELGVALVEKYGIEERTSCSVCHR